ncbi:TraR/DksA C4-type zinc finger protein [Collinsella sp. AGMB00827]|uniref:TraR/DksA C4-type zinc finger protein n=1 Tax=Collinsella ureilytica TaxID=2869515 RepID=A0ABS7MIW8_9ACTN|nr:FmdE family protein [Collinsella urealyticum]MBY4797197.1 TraR/DksA C4-type zinc finger protein [Collinsella urealyticum]
MNQEKWEACVTFHGHECPGLAIGYRAAEIAEEFFGRKLSPKSDEMIVCITENDACGVDAVQVMTGCTIGKGNLIFRPTGKMAFSFFDRDTEKAVRVLLKPLNNDEDREAKTKQILEDPVDEVFIVETPHYGVPERARIFHNVVCELCGETAMEQKIRIQDGKKVCLDCFKDYSRGW